MTSTTDPRLWGVAAGLTLLVALGVWWQGWAIQWGGVRTLALGVLALAAVGAIYHRRSAPLARLASAMALGLALAYLAQLSTYVLGTTLAPFRDAELRALDRALGFDWPAWAAWVARHPIVANTFAAVYPTHILETGAALALAALRTTDGASRFLRAFLVAMLVAGVGLVLCPALGYHLDADATAVRLALRDGSFTTLDLGQLAGIISMPSMHAALAVLTSLACWPIRWTRWPLGGLNAVVVVATISVGGHYLVDVLAGVLLAGFAWWAAGPALPQPRDERVAHHERPRVPREPDHASVISRDAE